MDLSILSEQFCDDSSVMRGYSAATIRRYKTTIKTLLLVGKITQTEACTNDRLRMFFYRGRAERKWSVGTFATYHDTLAVFFRWCVDQGHLETNPIDGIDVPKRPRPLPRGLRQEQSERLLEVVQNYPYRLGFERHRNYALFATLLLTGLRRKEVLQLHMIDVDLKGRTVFVREGKGGKDRAVPMEPTLVRILGTYSSERSRAHKTCPEFFTSLTRNTGLSNDGLKHIVSEARRMSGITFTVHQLRHTFATLMLEGGSDIFSISQMMGHSDIKTTTIYMAATPEHLRAQIAKHPLGHL